MNGENRPTTQLDERIEPPVFIGRQSELEDLREKLEYISLDVVNAKGGLNIVTGIPGVGKTALLNQFIKESIEVFGEGNLNVVRLSAEEIMFSGDSTGYFAKTLSTQTEIPESVEQIGKRGVGGRIAGKLPFLKGERKASSETTARYVKEIKIEKPTIVVIDEILNLHSGIQSNVDDAKRLMSYLHQGDHGLPIMTLCAGLPNTLDRLADLGFGISRNRRSLRLGLFSDAETRECIPATLAYYGYNDVPQDWIERMATLSQNFPHHVSAYCIAFEKTMTGQSGYSKQLLKSVLDEGYSIRREYYLGRLKSMGDNARYLNNVYVRELLKTDGPIEVKSLKRAIDGYANEEESEVDAEIIVNQSTANGIFHREVSGDPLSVPIPSLRTFMTRTTNEDPGDEERYGDKKSGLER